MLNYDSRDNIFTPTSGTDMEIKAGLYDKTWGGDDDFKKFTAYLKHYQPITKKWVLGVRADVRAINGDAPFYEYPFIEMRGIKMLRYQGEKTALGEMELRWSVTPRWVLVGFAGAGKAFAKNSNNDSDVIYSKGLGIRYLIASRLGLQTGIDVAKGPEDTAIYFQVGSSWLR
ncbi:MAG: BamA/TamA family outer membrane protein [gamma proteobacterium symbiont of Bathyaustriella thionipta]|nr:BamA/TamA family outer membrane protein [gamma proteobacterium symbiont of Bathyaustriella thionipta]